MTNWIDWCPFVDILCWMLQIVFSTIKIWVCVKILHNAKHWHGFWSLKNPLGLSTIQEPHFPIEPISYDLHPERRLNPLRTRPSTSIRETPPKQAYLPRSALLHIHSKDYQRSVVNRKNRILTISILKGSKIHQKLSVLVFRKGTTHIALGSLQHASKQQPRSPSQNCCSYD